MQVEQLPLETWQSLHWETMTSAACPLKGWLRSHPAALMSL